MASRQKVYFPPRLALSGTVSGNLIQQLEFSDYTEEVELTVYNKRGVSGWTLKKKNGESVLVVPKKTTAKFEGLILLLPDVLTIPSSKDDSVDGQKWLLPKIKKIGSDIDLTKICSEVHSSWENNFNFIKELRTNDNIERYGLRPPQLGALHASLAHWTVTEEIATIVMPTGTGKTETMLALLASERLKKLLVIVPTDALREQIFDKFLTFGLLQKFGILDKNAKLPVVGKIKHYFKTVDEANLYMASCNVAVATMGVISSCSSEIQEAIVSRCSHIFFDEAHHIVAQTWNYFRELARDYKKPILQFTATPFRRDGKHIGGNSIFTYPLRKAQEEGYFKKINFISVWEYNLEVADETIAKKAIQVLKEDIEKNYDHLLMARTNKINKAKEVYKIYNNLAPEYNPLIIHSELNNREKVQALEKLNLRKSRIIVCVDMLGEGFDLPQLKIAALHNIHKSLAVTIQFTGRFTRSTSGIGEATIIANAADANVEEALEDLYSKDADWNVLLRQFSEGETNLQRQRSHFLKGFKNVPADIAIQNIYPKMSTVVYKTCCNTWTPEEIRKSFKEEDLLIEPTINPEEKVVLVITCQKTSVAWGRTKNIHDVVHHLYLAFWDDRQNLLFINSTNNKNFHTELAKNIAGADVCRIQGEDIYRCLHNVKRSTLSNLGLLHLHNRAKSFTMHSGSDIKEGLSRASVDNRIKSNLFTRGYEDGEKMTIGGSHKGRIWSHRIADDISEWVEWCKHLGAKLLDSSISTEQILEQSIIPEKISERPNLVPIAIDWSPYFYARSDEAVQIEINGRLEPFYLAELGITTFSKQGFLRFSISLEGVQIEYEIIFKENIVTYIQLGNAEVNLYVSGKKETLSDWFQVEPPIIRFEDTSVLKYDEIYRPKNNREPYDKSKIECWSWQDVDLTKESQYKAKASSNTLIPRQDSIQRKVINSLIQGNDIVFDDDGAGEIADIVTLKVAGDNLLVNLVHCKYSKSYKAGVRVGDLYEVCGQAQKSVFWRSEISKLFQRLKFREQERQKKYSVSRFEKGDLQKLEELRRHSRSLHSKFHIYIVQPGVKTSNISTQILDLLGATELYLLETFNVQLTVIASP